MKNIFKICILIVLSISLLTSCKEYKLKTCVICGEKTNCYKVIYDNTEKYYDWVCSSKCEKKAIDFINGLEAIVNAID